MKWVTMWGNAQSTVMPNPAIYAKDLTLRYPIFIPFNGNKIRITLDNFCCNEDVFISNVSVGIGNKLSDAQDEISYDVKFNNQLNVKIPAHQTVVSDELDIFLKENQYLIVSIYLGDYTNLTSGVDIIGPLSRGYFGYGNQLKSNRLDVNKSKSTSWVYFLSNIDIYTSDDNEAIICYGDSITSQDWPDYMLLSLRENGINNVSVVRKAVSGTRILRQYECITYQSYGLCGGNRFTHEVGSVCGANNIIIQHGINDIIHPVGSDVNIFRPMSDMPSVLDLIEGIQYYIEEAKKMNLKPFIGTLLPIYGWRTYALFREEIKNQLNEWILSLNCIDFNNEIGHNVNGEYHFNDNCDSGDHLHPSKHAYNLMGKLAVKTIFSIKE